MRRRYNLAHLILAGVVVLGLTQLMIVVKAQVQIAFASDRKGVWENFEIYMMDVDGGNRRRLTNNRGYDWDPSWSPDGKRVAFTSISGENAEIYVMDDDGKNQRNLTKHPHDDTHPA